MYSKKFSVILLSILFSTTVFAFSGGDGTTINPYQISTPLHLEEVNNDLSANYILINNVDLEGITYNSAIIAPDTDDQTGGFQGSEFSGSFDGNGYAIKNITITGEYISYLGLFGMTGYAEIKNINIIDCQISGGYVLGGLCGQSNSTQISKSYVSGIVDGTGYIGGICGRNDDSVIVESAFNGSINGVFSVGGLTGRNSGVIENSYSSGNIICDVQGNSVGGLCGENDGEITKCYSTALVSAGIYTGGLCGWNSGSIEDCFWDTQTSGQNTSAGGIGVTTAQMQDIETFIGAGWDIETFIGAGWDIDIVWVMIENSYPQLKWQFFPSPDLNKNGYIYVQDILEFAGYWLKTNCEYPDWCDGTDFNTDGTVDLLDYSLIADFWLTGETTTPNVVGMSEENAEIALIDAKLLVGEISYEFSNNTSIGHVISQYPESEQSVGLDTVVDLLVSKGPIPAGGDTTASSWEVVNERWVRNYYPNGDITMSDKDTGLMWLYNASMLGTANWSTAKSICNNLTYAGHSDWFLPDRWELKNMCNQMLIFSSFQSGRYWSSTPYENLAYFVYIGSNNCFTSYVPTSVTSYYVWGCRTR